MAYDDIELESTIDIQIEVTGEVDPSDVELDSTIELVREY